ncbi:MAG: hypothetical protein D6734_09420 [Candidatus Schekmanbacteria bacterium]|nr:MAG: hypothetical protein D6734_09420 [Candidatus Schekmanbacteria bacterium]
MRRNLRKMVMIIFTAGLIFTFSFVQGLWAEKRHNNAEEDEIHNELHFVHPLIAETPSPDNTIRVDYFFRNINSDEDDADEHTVRFVGEYAINRSISLQIEAPYTWREPSGEPTDSSFDNFEFIAKYANFVFEEKGILIGGGLRLGLPTGDTKEEIGSNHIVEFEPFLDAGYKKGNFETTATLSFGFPSNQRDEEENEEEATIGYNLSLLYHLNRRIEALVEFDGESVLSGDADGPWIINITPGIKVRPSKDADFDIGVGVSLPLSNTEEFDVQTIVSAILHF